MGHVIICRGLSGSGKSTFALDLIATDSTYIRTNRDSLRTMLHDNHYNSRNEKVVVAVRNAAITEALRRGFNVVVDDTNIALSNIRAIKSLVETSARELGVTHTLEIKEFNVDPSECVKRDAMRIGKPQVGEWVIMEQHRQMEEIGNLWTALNQNDFQKKSE